MSSGLTRTNGNEMPASVVAGQTDWWEDEAKFVLIQRVATMLSRSKLVPATFQGDEGVGSCVIALNMANRLNADPLMVMQNLYIVHGRPSWSAQFMIACFNKTGRFSPLRYEFVGNRNGDDWGCHAIATDLDSGEVLQGTTITISIAKAEGWYSKNGSKWKTMPEQMLRYRAATFFVRAYAPELTMGLLMEDEVRDIGPPAAERRRVTAQDIADLQIEETPAMPEVLSRSRQTADNAGEEPQDIPPDHGEEPQTGPDEHFALLVNIQNAESPEMLTELQRQIPLLQQRGIIDASGAKALKAAAKQREAEL